MVFTLVLISLCAVGDDVGPKGGLALYRKCGLSTHLYSVCPDVLPSRYKRWKVSAMTTIVGIFDSTRDMDQAVERLAEAGFEDTVYDDAIVALEAVNVGPVP